MSSSTGSTPQRDTTVDERGAEAAAERPMAAYRVQQAVESGHAGRDRAASRWIIVIFSALFGAAAGWLMGAMRGHALAGAFLMAVVGGLLGLIGQRRL